MRTLRPINIRMRPRHASAIPEQRPNGVPVSNSRFRPEIIEAALEAQLVRTRGTTAPPDSDDIAHHVRIPCGLRMANFGGSYEKADRAPQLQIPSNMKRRRFLLANPSGAPGILYWGFGKAASGLLELQPGEKWDESGSGIGLDEIWVASDTTGHLFVCYEGIPISDDPWETGDPQ